MPKSRTESGVSPEAALAAAVRGLRRGSVLVVGDAMLDRYVYGRVSRVSPEAPVPVMAIERETALPGGAANVVRNLTALGSAVAFVSVVGDDQAGSDLTGLIGGQPGIEPWLLVQGGRATTTKTRFVAAGQQMLRADQETAGPIHPRLADRLVRIATDAMAATRAIVLSDYRKGVLVGDVAPRLLQLARNAGRAVVVEPRGGDLERFAGADVIIPEPDELAAATGMVLRSPADIAHAAEALCITHRFGAVLVPRATHGLTLAQAGHPVRHIRAEASDADDPAGAGDAVVAVVATGLAVGLPLGQAVELAAIAMGVVTRKAGIALVRADELLEALSPGFHARHKLVSLPFASGVVERWRHRGWRVGLLHLQQDAAAQWSPALMEQARQWCDRLVVCVCDEAGQALAGWPMVDLVAYCEGRPNDEMLRLFRPDVLAHGPKAVPLGLDDENLLAEWGGALRRAVLQEAAE